MKKISIGIYDNEEVNYHLIQSAIQSFFTKQKTMINVVRYNESLLSYEIDNVDLIYVHIKSQHELRFAHQLRLKGYTNDIIFYSESKEFAFESFSFYPFAYLLLPLTKESIIDVLNKYILLRKKEERTIWIRDSRGNPKYVLAISHIEYIESSNTKLTIYLNSGHILKIYGKLTDVEEEIHDRRFLRCHQSYLINMDYVKEVCDTFEMFSGASVPMRVRNKKKVRDEYYQYLLIK